ncbi:MAG TPA: hypothetical protein VIM27_10085 [Gaiellales bacterium]|jgi:hypothetical protein
MSAIAAGSACASTGGLEWERIAGVIEEAYISVAPSRLVADP